MSLQTYFILFITSNSFILLNLLIATVVELIQDIGRKKRQKMRETRHARAGSVGDQRNSYVANPAYRGGGDGGSAQGVSIERYLRKVTDGRGNAGSVQLTSPIRDKLTIKRHPSGTQFNL